MVTTPNVVLIVLDTTRADHLSLYGHERETTPRLDAFAREAITFDRAYATSTWTVASHGSLFTGLLPITHQATQENTRLDDELDTLAEILTTAGYETAAFTNNSWISQVTNLSQGFQTLEPMWKQARENIPAAEGAEASPRRIVHPTNRAVEKWLEGRGTDRPLFLFVNYMEAHWPYHPSDSDLNRFAAGIPPKILRRAGFSAIQWYTMARRPPPPVLAVRAALYDATLRGLDEGLGELLELLRGFGLFENTLLIITADHGENLGEHGHQGHSFALYDSTLRIPLVMRRPDGRDTGTHRNDPVQLTDVFVTIARAAGISDFDARVVGFDLLAGPVPELRPVIGEYYHPKTFLSRFPKSETTQRATAPFERRIRSIQVGPEKLIWGSDGRNELYRMDADPLELRNLVTQMPERAHALEAELDATLAPLTREIVEPQGPISEMDPAVIERLRALGYLP